MGSALLYRLPGSHARMQFRARHSFVVESPQAFEDDLLKGYSFWGHAQEDLILGDLLACIPPRRLQRFDAITPFRPPLNSSGVFMLMRNTPKINRLWRRSADAARVLSDPKYLVRAFPMPWLLQMGLEHLEPCCCVSTSQWFAFGV
eukprot:6204658-Pleurochrysis_carterae.AAC.2